MSATPHERLAVEVEDEDDRYHRQSLISWWDQDRLADARILVVGAGALGNELLKNLALLGVGNVVVIDLDTVENSNLSRCVLFREADEGRPKAHVIADAARELNPGITITPVVGDVRTAFGLQVFAEMDVVLGGLDNREARLHVNGCCWKTSTPWVDGAIEGLMGTMRVFSPPDSACYECTMNDRDQELLAARRACSLLTRDQMLEGKVPTTATSASIIAAMQVQEAVKLLHRDRIDAPFGGKGVAYNGLTHDSYVVTYPRREDCLSHDTYDLDGATPVAAGTTFGELLQDGASRLGLRTVLDLEREIVTHLSCATCATEEAVFRPIEGLTQGAALCEVCGEERRLTLVHSISSEDEHLLGMTAAELGLPPFDVVTGRCEMARHHFLVGGDAFALEQLSRA
jgi:adenylyltransferase/sulfurtransferase